LLRTCGLALPAEPGRLRVITDQLGAGYGHPTAAALAARNRFAADGIELDLTYTAKSAAALRGLAASFRRLCLWHTFDPRLAPSRAVESPLLRRARAHAESRWPLPKST
jgi:D-cysteine desulfhydrase